MPIINVNKLEIGRSLVLTLDNGIDPKGKQLTASRTYSNIREKAPEADILNSANVIVSLQDKDVLEVIVQERSLLLR